MFVTSSKNFRFKTIKYLCWWKGSRDECDERDVFAFEDVPTVLQRTHRRLASTDGRGGSSLEMKKNVQIHSGPAILTTDTEVDSLIRT